MKAFTNYEVYVVKFGRWALHARFRQDQEDRALDLARAIEADSDRPTQVLEENFEPEPERLTIRVIAKNGRAELETSGPADATDIASRIIMVGVNALGIGVIVTALMAIALWSFRESAGATADALDMLLLFTFGATALLAGLVLVRIYLPVGMILWRGKSPESRHRASDALLHGSVTARPVPEDSATPTREGAAVLGPGDWLAREAAATRAREGAQHLSGGDSPTRARETNADQGEQTSFKIGAAPPSGSNLRKRIHWGFPDRYCRASLADAPDKARYQATECQVPRDA